MSYTNDAKGYIKKALISGETLQYQGRVTKIPFIPYYILGFFLIFGVFSGQPEGYLMSLAGLLLMVTPVIIYYTTELGITNKRIIAKTGLIMRNSVELNLDRVESIRVEQGILGRIFNYGTVILAGAGNPHAPMKRISNPLEFRKACLEIQEKADSNQL